MTIMLELTPEVEAQLTRQARQEGLLVKEYVQRAVEQLVKPKEFDINAFLALPRDEQDYILATAAEDAAPLYAADLALPVTERELTAFTALDGEPFHDDNF